MKNLALFILVILININLESAPENNSISNWKIVRTRTFKANDLYGYIDGGAELFLELGFNDLTAHQYSNGKDEITVDIYKMERSESAFGIYLFKCGKETPLSKISARNTGDRFQIMIYKGRYFIQINNVNGETKLVTDMITLANQVLKEIQPENLPNIFSLLPKQKLINHSELIIRGPYSLQTVYTFGEGDVLQLDGRIFGVMGDYKNENGKIYTRIIVQYPNLNFAKGAFSYLLSHLDPTKVMIDKKPAKFIFKDHAAKYGLVIQENNIINIMINLNMKPTI